MCGQCMDDMRTMFEWHKSEILGKILLADDHPHIIHTLSTHHPHVIRKCVCRPHIVRKHVNGPHETTALYEAYWLPCWIFSTDSYKSKFMLRLSTLFYNLFQNHINWQRNRTPISFMLISCTNFPRIAMKIEECKNYTSRLMFIYHPQPFVLT